MRPYETQESDPLHRPLGRTGHLLRVAPPLGRPPGAEQLNLDLDQITDTRLRLRDALPVRSAEHWLQLGDPELALRELAALPDTVRQHPWPLRVQLAAQHARSLQFQHFPHHHPHQSPVLLTPALRVGRPMLNDCRL